MNRILTALAILFLLSGCDLGSEGRPSAQGSSRDVDHHDERYNFDVSYPEGWFRAEEQLTILGNPNELLALATFPLQKGGGCAPKAARDEATSTDAIVFLMEFTGAVRMNLPSRPPTFDPLPEPEISECWEVPVATYRFRDSGGGFQVDVWLGDQIAAETKDDITAALDSLRFGTREREGPFFDRVVRVLEDREMGVLRHPTSAQRANAAPLRELEAKVQRRLGDHNSSAGLIDVTLGVFTSSGERLRLDDELMYVAHTGPFSTGYCLDFYDARTLRYTMGSCFLSDRDL